MGKLKEFYVYSSVMRIVRTQTVFVSVLLVTAFASYLFYSASEPKTPSWFVVFFSVWTGTAFSVICLYLANLRVEVESYDAEKISH